MILGGVLHRRGSLQRFQGGQVGSGGEDFSCAGEHHDPHRRLGSRLGQRAFRFGHEPVIERVAFVRSMQGDGGHAVTHVVANEFIRSEPLAIL